MPGDVKKKNWSRRFGFPIRMMTIKSKRLLLIQSTSFKVMVKFTIHVMKPADRDKALAKRVKEVKNQIKMEHKLELEDQSKKDKSSKKECEKV